MTCRSLAEIGKDIANSKMNQDLAKKREQFEKKAAEDKIKEEVLYISIIYKDRHSLTFYSRRLVKRLKKKNKNKNPRDWKNFLVLQKVQKLPKSPKIPHHRLCFPHEYHLIRCLVLRLLQRSQVVSFTCLSLVRVPKTKTNRLGFSYWIFDQRRNQDISSARF